MEYIEPEEFLKQSKKVQESLRNWWKPEMRDLFFRSFGDSPNSFLNGIYIGCIQDNETKNNAIAYKDFLPVLTEGQIRKYIEDKTNTRLSANIGEAGYQIVLYKFIEGSEEEYNKVKFYKEFDELGNDLLQVYWKVAIKIAEEE